MGAYLSQPNTVKSSGDGAGLGPRPLHFGFSAMQGWRVSMEVGACGLPGGRAWGRGGAGRRDFCVPRSQRRAVLKDASLFFLCWEPRVAARVPAALGSVGDAPSAVEVLTRGLRHARARSWVDGARGGPQTSRLARKGERAVQRPRDAFSKHEPLVAWRRLKSVVVVCREGPGRAMARELVEGGRALPVRDVLRAGLRAPLRAMPAAAVSAQPGWLCCSGRGKR